MDDQRVDREGGRSVIIRLLNRPRISLRLMLLLVALFSVLCAYYRASSDLHREKIKTQLIHLEERQRKLDSFVQRWGKHFHQETSELVQVNAEIAKTKRAIGEK